MSRMTDAEVLQHMRDNTDLNKLRQTFSSHSGRIEQAGQQRTPLGPIELRRMEFEAVAAIERRINQNSHVGTTHTGCQLVNCMICDGGLFVCANCGAAEIEAEQEHCAVRRLTPTEIPGNDRAYAPAKSE